MPFGSLVTSLPCPSSLSISTLPFSFIHSVSQSVIHTYAWDLVLPSNLTLTILRGPQALLLYVFTHTQASGHHLWLNTDQTCPALNLSFSLYLFTYSSFIHSLIHTTSHSLPIQIVSLFHTFLHVSLGHALKLNTDHLPSAFNLAFSSHSHLFSYFIHRHTHSSLWSWPLAQSWPTHTTLCVHRSHSLSLCLHNYQNHCTFSDNKTALNELNTLVVLLWSGKVLWKREGFRFDNNVIRSVLCHKQNEMDA